jgi:transposase
VSWTPVELGYHNPEEVSRAKTSWHVQPYSPELRAEAIRLAQTSGKSQRQFTEDLGMTSETLRLWLKQADLDEGKRHDGLTSDEQEELRRRREVRILREEREILKKPRPSSPEARETDAIR